MIRSGGEAKDEPVRMRRELESSHAKLESDGLASQEVLENLCRVRSRRLFLLARTD